MLIIMTTVVFQALLHGCNGASVTFGKHGSPFYFQIKTAYL